MPQSYYAKENIGENSQTEENLQKKNIFTFLLSSPHHYTWSSAQHTFHYYLQQHYNNNK